MDVGTPLGMVDERLWKHKIDSGVEQEQSLGQLLEQVPSG